MFNVRHKRDLNCAGHGKILQFRRILSQEVFLFRLIFAGKKNEKINWTRNRLLPFSLTILNDDNLECFMYPEAGLRVPRPKGRAL